MKSKKQYEDLVLKAVIALIKAPAPGDSLLNRCNGQLPKPVQKQLQRLVKRCVELAGYVEPKPVSERKFPQDVRVGDTLLLTPRYNEAAWIERKLPLKCKVLAIEHNARGFAGGVGVRVESEDEEGIWMTIEWFTGFADES